MIAPPACRVILTRPNGDNPAWVGALHNAGYRVEHWPLIDIAPVSHAAALRDLFAAAVNAHALVFVSPNAVAQAWAAGWRHDTHHHTRYWVTGPGSQQALREVGVPESRIDAPPENAPQFDTEALWQTVKHQVQAQQTVWIFRGTDADHADATLQGVGRDWLMRQLQAEGVIVKTAAVYQRMCPTWLDAQLAEAARAAHDHSVWVFTSSQAVAHLQRLLPSQDWRAARAIATHERIARAAERAGFSKVWVSQPTQAALLASLESLA